MTELSPAAQLMIAVAHVYQEHGGDPPARAIAAAAIRAVAEQGETFYWGGCPVQAVPVGSLLAIADEIESQ